MCTVTYIPYGDKVFITSNRDEKITRGSALPPEAYNYESGRMLYPKDSKADGTWIATHANGNVMVLLNGAFKKHIIADNYRKSRGIVFLEIFDGLNPVEIFSNSDLEMIEPFTILLYKKDEAQLWEMRWDGSKKFIFRMENNVPQIWSSVTLYDESIIRRRQSWFDEWLIKNSVVTTDLVRKFHEFAGDGNEYSNLNMNYNGILRTVSITSIIVEPEKCIMQYKDMITGAETIHEWLFAGQSYSV